MTTATPLINFEDAVTASNLNPAQRFAVYYADGHYANQKAVRARCPHAALYAITVLGLTGKGIFACDCEEGDMTVAQTVAWVGKQIALNVELVCVYANLDRWTNQGLLTALSHHGSRIKRWVADYTNVPAIPAWADAEQFATGSVDKDVALANFFKAATPVKPVPKPPAPKANTGTVRFTGSLNLANETYTIHKLLSTGKRQVGQTYKATVEVDVKPGAAVQLHITRQT